MENTGPVDAPKEKAPEVKAEKPQVATNKAADRPTLNSGKDFSKTADQQIKDANRPDVSQKEKVQADKSDKDKDSGFSEKDFHKYGKLEKPSLRFNNSPEKQEALSRQHRLDNTYRKAGMDTDRMNSNVVNEKKKPDTSEKQAKQGAEITSTSERRTMLQFAGQVVNSDLTVEPNWENEKAENKKKSLGGKDSESTSVTETAADKEKNLDIEFDQMLEKGKDQTFTKTEIESLQPISPNSELTDMSKEALEKQLQLINGLLDGDLSYDQEGPVAEIDLVESFNFLKTAWYEKNAETNRDSEQVDRPGTPTADQQMEQDYQKFLQEGAQEYSDAEVREFQPINPDSNLDGLSIDEIEQQMLLVNYAKTAILNGDLIVDNSFSASVKDFIESAEFLKQAWIELKQAASEGQPGEENMPDTTNDTATQVSNESEQAGQNNQNQIEEKPGETLEANIEAKDGKEEPADKGLISQFSDFILLPGNTTLSGLQTAEKYYWFKSMLPYIDANNPEAVKELMELAFQASNDVERQTMLLNFLSNPVVKGITKGLSILDFGLSTKNFIQDPNVVTGVDLGVSSASLYSAFVSGTLSSFIGAGAAGYGIGKIADWGTGKAFGKSVSDEMADRGIKVSNRVGGGLFGDAMALGAVVPVLGIGVDGVTWAGDKLINDVNWGKALPWNW